MLLNISSYEIEGLTSAVTEYQLELIFDDCISYNIGAPLYDLEECVKLGKEIVDNFAKQFIYVKFNYC